MYKRRGYEHTGSKVFTGEEYLSRNLKPTNLLSRHWESSPWNEYCLVKAHLNDPTMIIIPNSDAPRTRTAGYELAFGGFADGIFPRVLT